MIYKTIFITISCTLGVVSSHNICMNLNEGSIETSRLLRAESAGCLGFKSSLNDTMRQMICRTLDISSLSNMTKEEAESVLSARKKHVLEEYSQQAETISALFNDMHGYSQAAAAVAFYEAKLRDQSSRQFAYQQQICHAVDATLEKLLEVRKKTLLSLPINKMPTLEEQTASWNRTAADLYEITSPEGRLAAECLIKQLMYTCTIMIVPTVRPLRNFATNYTGVTAHTYRNAHLRKQWNHSV